MILDAAPWWVVAVVSIVFGCIGFLATVLAAFVCKSIVPFDDGPKPGTPPTRTLVASSAVFGGLLVSHVGLNGSVLVPAIVLVGLVASCYSDVVCGIIPDWFTLVPIAIVLLARALTAEWTLLIVTLAVTAVFGLAAFVSRGRGMGWGDVKLVALGALALGDRALLAFAAACLAAVVIAALRRKRAEPVAFAPYLAAAIAAGMALPIFPGVGL